MVVLMIKQKTIHLIYKKKMKQKQNIVITQYLVNVMMGHKNVKELEYHKIIFMLVYQKKQELN